MSEGNRVPDKGRRRARFLRLLFGSCDRTRFLLSKSLDARLSWSEALRKYAHLATCSSCRHYRQQLQIIRRFVRCYRAVHPEAAANWRLSTEARERIKKKIRDRIQRPDSEQCQVEAPEYPRAFRLIHHSAHVIPVVVAVRTQSLFCSPAISTI